MSLLNKFENIEVKTDILSVDDIVYIEKLQSDYLITRSHLVVYVNNLHCYNRKNQIPDPTFTVDNETRYYQKGILDVNIKLSKDIISKNIIVNISYINILNVYNELNNLSYTFASNIIEYLDTTYNSRISKHKVLPLYEDNNKALNSLFLFDYRHFISVIDKRYLNGNKLSYMEYFHTKTDFVDSIYYKNKIEVKKDTIKFGEYTTPSYNMDPDRATVVRNGISVFDKSIDLQVLPQSFSLATDYKIDSEHIKTIKHQNNGTLTIKFKSIESATKFIEFFGLLDRKC